MTNVTKKFDINANLSVTYVTNKFDLKVNENEKNGAISRHFLKALLSLVYHALGQESYLKFLFLLTDFQKSILK